MDVTFPNESTEYRTARHALLRREGGAAPRDGGGGRRCASLPPGGEVREDYVFDGLDANGDAAKLRLSELFRAGTDTLFVYHFMFPRHQTDDRRKAAAGPIAALQREAGPCPSPRTALLDHARTARSHTSRRPVRTWRAWPRRRSTG